MDKALCDAVSQFAVKELAGRIVEETIRGHFGAAARSRPFFSSSHKGPANTATAIIRLHENAFNVSDGGSSRTPPRSVATRLQ